MTADAKLALCPTEREQFEAVFSVSPYEFSLARWPENHRYSWPGQYRAYHVQAAWEAWQARAQAAPQGPAQSEVDRKAARWDYLCRHWSLLTTKHNKDGTLKSVVLTLNANAQGRAGSPRLDSVIGQAIAEESAHGITGAPNGKPT